MRFLVVIVVLLYGGVCLGGEYVRGYYRDSNGDGMVDEYVQPYIRSHADGSVWNNYNLPSPGEGYGRRLYPVVPRERRGMDGRLEMVPMEPYRNELR